MFTLCTEMAVDHALHPGFVGLQPWDLLPGRNSISIEGEIGGWHSFVKVGGYVIMNLEEGEREYFELNQGVIFYTGILTG